MYVLVLRPAKRTLRKVLHGSSNGQRKETDMEKYKVTLIPGDGIGPEVSFATQRCIEAAGVTIDWEVVHAGTEIMEKKGTPLPQDVIDSVRRNKIAIKGPVTTPIGSGFRSVNVALRKDLDLFACLRPCKLYP